MKKMKIAFMVLITIMISSCSSLSSISNGGYSDVSLNKNSNEYELKRLNEITVEGTALFGIPMKAKKQKGVVVRFNGIDLGKSSQILPIITMLAYTFSAGTMINEIVGTNNDWNSNNYGKDKLGVLPSMALGIPIAGILNNITWSGAAMQNASWNLNSRLVEENPNVDIFLNPKYEIENTQGFFTQKAKVKAKVMGATIKTD
ncbi:hypothetical protein [Lutibacter sp.]|uniref:hypothetical protein n=1 Tax=Lutibacter sp. TaxID=1925666 RepID=UPI00356592D5